MKRSPERMPICLPFSVVSSCDNAVSWYISRWSIEGYVAAISFVAAAKTDFDSGGLLIGEGEAEGQLQALLYLLLSGCCEIFGDEVDHMIDCWDAEVKGVHQLLPMDNRVRIAAKDCPIEDLITGSEFIVNNVSIEVFRRQIVS